MDAARSSNGRTAAFGAVGGGSNPSRAANFVSEPSARVSAYAANYYFATRDYLHGEQSSSAYLLL